MQMNDDARKILCERNTKRKTHPSNIEHYKGQARGTLRRSNLSQTHSFKQIFEATTGVINPINQIIPPIHRDKFTSLYDLLSIGDRDVEANGNQFRIYTFSTNLTKNDKDVMLFALMPKTIHHRPNGREGAQQDKHAFYGDDADVQNKNTGNCKMCKIEIFPGFPEPTPELINVSFYPIDSTAVVRAFNKLVRKIACD